MRENEIAPPSAFANAASVFDLNHDLDEDNPSSTSSSTNTKAAEASEHNEANAAATAAAATDAAYSDQKSSATNSNEVQPTSLLATVLGATSNNVAPATVSPPADPMAVPAVASPSCVLTTAAESAGAGPGSADAPLEAATSTNNEAAAATSAAAAVEEANKRAAKLAKAACSLVLLREAPTRWDVHRNQVHRSYAAEAIARGEEIVQLKRALARAQAAAAGRSNQDFHPHTADTARAGTGATAAAEEDTRVTAFTSHLPPPPTTSRIKVKSSLTPTPPRPPPTSARGRIVRFLVEKGGLTAGSSSSRSHSHVCSPEQCEAFFGCSDLETLAENADAKVGSVYKKRRVVFSLVSFKLHVSSFTYKLSSTIFLSFSFFTFPNVLNCDLIFGGVDLLGGRSRVSRCADFARACFHSATCASALCDEANSRFQCAALDV